jgi:ATP-dependent Zn protease
MTGGAGSEEIAAAVQRESRGLIDYLHGRKQDLVVSAIALHCAFVAAIHVLKNSMPSEQIKPLLEMLHERETVTLSDVEQLMKVDEKVGIA